MVDSVLIAAPHVDRLPALADATETSSTETGEVTLRGFYRHLHVTRRPDGETMICGSLPRFVRGCNVETLDYIDLCRAVDELVYTFGLDARESRVYRLDLAATMQMPRPVGAYLSVLSVPSRMREWCHGGETRTFQNTQRSLSFYDKGRESGCDGSHGNLLRFEVKYKKGLKRQLSRAVSLEDLRDWSFFVELARRWQEQYKTVGKRARPFLEPTQRPSELRDQLAAIGLMHAGGADVLQVQMEGWGVDRRVLYRLRQESRRLESNGRNERDVDLVQELDQAVSAAALLALTNYDGKAA